MTITLIIHFYIVLFVFVLWLHKGMQHNLFTGTPAFTFVMRFVMWTFGWGVKPDWLRLAVGTHMMHHKYSDTIDDPHSPWSSSLFGLTLDQTKNPFYQKYTDEYCESVAPANVPVFNDWAQKYIFNDHWPVFWKCLPFRFTERVGVSRIKKFWEQLPCIGTVLAISAFAVAFGWTGLIVGTIWIYFLKYIGVGFVVAIIPHTIGFYRHPNHKGPDRSINSIPIGILLLGGELHNNHHVNPRTLNDRAQWFEFDSGYWLLKLFEKFGWIEFNYRIIVPNKI